MNFDRERLLRLLPAVYSQRDHALGGPLGDLLGVLAEQIQVIEEDLDQLYDDQFIETCAEWVVPYLGDVIGYRSLHSVSATVGRARAEVAHTIGYRRRKGTLSVLEALARDVTGWHCSGAEFFQRLVTSQYMNHVRRQHHATPDLRQWRALEALDTAFDAIPRSVDVRRIDSRRGRHNIANVGLFAWRLAACPWRFATPARVDTRRLRCHPLDIDAPLFTRPDDEERGTGLVSPIEVPGRISRRVLAEDLGNLSSAGQYYADTDEMRSLRLYLDRNDGAGFQAVARSALRACHLGDLGASWAHLPPAGIIAIDPVLGRLALPPEATNAWRLRVTWHYGFPAELGGGEYERAGSFDAGEDSAAPPPTREVPTQSPTHQDAIDFLGHAGVVLITDNHRYEETLTINVPADGRLEIRAANDCRPTLLLGAALELRGGANSEVRLNGLLIGDEAINVPASGGNALARLDLRHCTLVPGLSLAPDLTPSSGAASLVIRLSQFAVTLSRCIVGPVRAPEGATLRAVDCAIDAMAMDALAFCAPDPGADPQPGAALTLEGCTVVGRITALRMPLVSNCILWARSVADEPAVHSELRQDGCVRFTWLPGNSRTPRRHRCLPESLPGDVVSTLPRFTSLSYGAPGYLQLNVASGPRLMTGADDETEPGVYHHLANTWRETNLRVRLDEYLRVGLVAGIFYET